DHIDPTNTPTPTTHHLYLSKAPRPPPSTLSPYTTLFRSMENTNLSKQQQVSEIMRQMLTQAQTAGQYFTNDQIKEMTRKVSAEVDLVHQQTQNQRYGSSHIGA